jgi:hypothetical protein
MTEDAPEEDVYAAQRQELLDALTACLREHRPFTAIGRPVLGRDDIPALLQKIKHEHPFSRKERNALKEAGFQVEKLYPKL